MKNAAARSFLDDAFESLQKPKLFIDFSIFQVQQKNDICINDFALMEKWGLHEAIAQYELRKELLPDSVIGVPHHEEVRHYFTLLVEHGILGAALAQNEGTRAALLKVLPGEPITWDEPDLHQEDNVDPSIDKLFDHDINLDLPCYSEPLATIKD